MLVRLRNVAQRWCKFKAGWKVKLILKLFKLRYRKYNREPMKTKIIIGPYFKIRSLSTSKEDVNCIQFKIFINNDEIQKREIDCLYLLVPPVKGHLYPTYTSFTYQKTYFSRIFYADFQLSKIVSDISNNWGFDDSDKPNFIEIFAFGQKYWNFSFSFIQRSMIPLV